MMKYFKVENSQILIKYLVRGKFLKKEGERGHLRKVDVCVRGGGFIA